MCKVFSFRLRNKCKSKMAETNRRHNKRQERGGREENESEYADERCDANTYRFAEGEHHKSIARLGTVHEINLVLKECRIVHNLVSVKLVCRFFVVAHASRVVTTGSVSLCRVAAFRCTDVRQIERGCHNCILWIPWVWYRNTQSFHETICIQLPRRR